MKNIILMILAGGIALLAGCATRPTTQPTHSWTPPCDACVSGVVNFAKVSPLLWRGSQPTEDGFRNLANAGVKTVIDLREEHDDYDDFSKLGGAHVKYIRIPMHAWDPENAQIVVLMKTLERAFKDSESSPVYIHCAEGRDRTGYSIAAYRMVFEGWAPNDAIQEMFDFRFNTAWFRNPGFLQKLDVNKIKTLMSLAP